MLFRSYRLQFNQHATIVKDKGTKVPVVLWEIAPQDWRNLDRYEGYPSYYRKELVNVKVGGVERASLVYIMNKPDFAISPPTQAYLDGIKRGCKQHGIDTGYLDNAYADSIQKARQFQTRCKRPSKSR